MPKYEVRMREMRVHHLVVEAKDIIEAEEIAGDMEPSDSKTDMFDAWEFMDATEAD